jgi:hypothetical protein
MATEETEYGAHPYRKCEKGRYEQHHRAILHLLATIPSLPTATGVDTSKEE